MSRLGLFGVLWQNISRRKQEIGVRRAMGSSKAEINYPNLFWKIMVLCDH
ncbi:FtsX-like permease family protein [Okeania hirsuta]|uniref:FtsX-like permease family protein n=1 Tax=Okeania hirsuta TaxID=1458930 RepID=A0A3N6NVV8_9CYAN|nr:FtsX-like permease family protein [Okeania hirsuta]